jgi:hypothetical protein
LPSGIAGSTGETSIVTSAAGVTSNAAVFDTDPAVAVTVTDPTLTDVARPAVAAALLIVATVPSDVLQWTAAVRSRVLPSVYKPVATNCCDVPSGIAALVGFTSSDTRTASVTCTEALPDTPPTVADTVAVPTVTPEAIPTGVMLTTVASVDSQRAVDVTTLVVSSEYVAVAENCCSVPFARLTGFGVTSIATMTAAVTVSVVDPVTPEAVAPIVVDPTARDVARPADPADMLTVAIPASDDVHETVPVMSRFVPSLKTPVAVNCLV